MGSVDGIVAQWVDLRLREVTGLTLVWGAFGQVIHTLVPCHQAV